MNYPSPIGTDKKEVPLELPIGGTTYTPYINIWLQNRHKQNTQ